MQKAENRIFVEHVKGLFKPDMLLALQKKMTQLENTQSLVGVTDREKSAIDRGESADALRMQSTWYDVWKNPTSRETLLETLSPFSYVIYPVQVRHVRKAYIHNVPWHQDIAYIRLLGKRSHYQVFTCFIPIEPEPSKCTTIQFARDNQNEPNYVYPHTALEGFGAGIKDTEFKDVFHFDLNLGDALIFGDHTLHRTYTPDNCEIERRSLEFRLVMPQHAITDKDYFDIEKLAFIRFDEKMQLTANAIA